MRRLWLLLVAALAVFVWGAPLSAAELPVVRVGTLKYGTVDWELAVIRRHGLDRSQGFVLKDMDFAGRDGAATALVNGEVDVIMTDWLWVAKRRSLGGDFVFVPHSHPTGGLMVRRNAGINDVADLKGRKIGIGGGGTDESWILLRAYAQKRIGVDLGGSATPVFASPPQLNQLMRRGELSASLNFWQYGARLDPNMFQELIRVEDMLAVVGLPADTPLLGWVFNAGWGRSHPAAIERYLAAVAAARHILATQPEEWQAIRKVIGAESDQELERLRLAYVRGVIAQQQPAAVLAGEAQRMIDLLIRLGEREDVPADGKVPQGTFYGGFHF
jgi:NitT/TauT family transport system substrate-binding protein